MRAERLRRAALGLALALLSVLIALSVTCAMSIEPYYAADEGLANYGRLQRFVTYCLRSFPAELSLTSLLALGAASLLFLTFRLRPTLREGALSGVFGLLFAFMQTLCRSYAENGSWDGLFLSGFVRFRALVAVSGKAVLCAALCFLAFRLADRAGESAGQPGPFSKKRFFMAAGAVCLCWLPYYLFFFPGLNNPDTSMQIAWALHYPTEWLKYSAVRGPEVFATNHHPYFTTVLFGLFARLGLLLGDIRWGVGAYNLLQLTATALVMTGGWFYLRHIGISGRVSRWGLVFTALFPLFPLYAITMLKDSLFSLALLTLAMLLFETVRTAGGCLRRWQFCVLLVLNAFLVMFSKNQGVYMIAVIGVGCLLIKGARLRGALCLLIPAALFQTLWVGVLLPAWNVAPAGRQEALGLLFQQTARFVTVCPEEVRPEEEAAIRAVLDYDELDLLYDPMQSDSVKFTFNQDATGEEMSAYFRAWLNMFRRRPDIYAQAFICNVYAGFYVEHETPLSYTHYDNREVASYPELCVPTPARVERLEPLISQGLRAVQHLPGVGLLFSVGFFPWAILFLFLDALRRRQYGLILPMLPCILSVAMLLVSPVSGSYRYAMPLTYAIPFLLGGCLFWRPAAAPANTHIDDKTRPA